MEQRKIFISTSSFAKDSREPLDILEKSGFTYEINPYGRKLTGEELVLLAAGSVGLIAGTEKIDSGVLNKLSCIKIISRCGTGMDNVDLKTAAALGIKVVNTPDAPTQAVAELTVGLIIDMLRKISLMDREIRGGSWNKATGNLLHGKRVGIIGLGRIGKRAAQLLNGFGCELAYYDTYTASDFLAMPRMELSEILSWADIITIHISASERLIGADEFKLMKKGSWIVNTSRGNVIDESALAANLSSGHLNGAAIDVFNEEPYKGKLCELPNIVLTPHIGSYAKEARINMEVESVKNLWTAFGEVNQ
jgi:D-3-phosphoglycerate dehydrogenase